MAADRSVREPGAGLEVALVAARWAVLGAGFATWLGARLAVAFTGAAVNGGVERLAPRSRPAWPVASRRPRRGASGERAPGRVALLDVHRRRRGWPPWRSRRAGAGVAPGRRPGGGQRRRFGQRTEAREARPPTTSTRCRCRRSIPPTGGCCSGGCAARPAPRHRGPRPPPARRAAARRQGNRGSVALIGPTGSGKTALATSAIATWDGPVVAVSVKRDLYDTTAAARAGKGEIAVFDPGAATDLATARWSPLTSVTTSSGALRTGRALAQAIPRSGVTNADYWAKHGEKLLGAFMCLAGLSRLLQPPDGQAAVPGGRTWSTRRVGHRHGHRHRTDHQPDPQAGPRQAPAARGQADGPPRRHHVHRRRQGGPQDPLVDLRDRRPALDPWLEPSVAHSASDYPRPLYWSDDH